MKAKYKVTGFGRLFIFLLLISPLCFVGANYIQKNPDLKEVSVKIIDKIKNANADNINSEPVTSAEEMLQDRIHDLESQIHALEAELKTKNEIIEDIKITKAEV